MALDLLSQVGDGTWSLGWGDAELGSKNVGGALGSPNGRPGPLGGECTTSEPSRVESQTTLLPWALDPLGWCL